MEAMRPPKQAPEAKGEPPQITNAKCWLESYAATVMPETGATWAEIMELAAGSVTEGALKKVRTKFIKPSGKAGAVRWFPLDSEVLPAEAAPPPPVAVVEPAPPQPASERLARFLDAENLDEFFARKGGEA